MASPTLVDLVKVRAASAGTGPISLGSNVSAFRGIEALVDGNTYSYSIQQGDNYEYGNGVYTAAGAVLTRGIEASSYGGAPIPLRAGTAVTFVALAASVAGGLPGIQGEPGSPGATGAPGDPGEGVPVGGTLNQALVKTSATDFDTEWTTINAAFVPTAEGGGNVQRAVDTLPIDVLWFAGSYAAWLAASDVGPFIRDAIAYALVQIGLDATQTYAILLPAGTVPLNLATECLIDDHRISLVCAGSNATIFECFGTGRGIHYRLDAAKFSVFFAGRLAGFSLVGSGAGAGSIGLEYGDVIGLELDDVIVTGFGGANSTGIWAKNVNFFTERTLYNRVHADNNTIDHRWTGGGTAFTSSFGYNKYQSLALNANASQTAVLIEGNSFLYNSLLNWNCNVADAGTVIKVRDTATAIRNFGTITAEQTSGTGGVAIDMGSANTWFHTTGAFHMGTLSIVDASGDNHTPRFWASTGFAFNDDGVPNMSASNFTYKGTADCRAYPLTADRKEVPYAESGIIAGANVQSPYVSMYDAVGNAFTVFKRGFGQPFTAAVECGSITKDGDVFASRHLIYSTEVYRQGIRILGAQGAAVADAATPTYVAPTGGIVTDAECRASLVQLAADVASLRASNAALLARIRAHGIVAT